MFIDKVEIKLEAGNGGNGAVTFRRTAQTAKGGPDGGDGGNGGSIWALTSSNVNDLSDFRFKKILKAQNGGNGGKHYAHGRNAIDLEIKLPVGTTITDLNTNRSVELTKLNQKILLAKGGSGGRGNNYFKSATNRTPRQFEMGKKGEKYNAIFNLKLIAEIGLIGLPNAGKSSLLNTLTNAKANVGNYPFTTLQPSLGMYENFSICDIPGIIEGAAKGKGLGIKFLKHIEKTNLLIHLVDISSPDPLNSYNIIRKEFEIYGGNIKNKTEIILLTKSDLVDKDTQKKYIDKFKNLNQDTYTVSIYDEKSILELKQILKTKLENK